MDSRQRPKGLILTNAVVFGRGVFASEGIQSSHITANQLCARRRIWPRLLSIVVHAREEEFRSS